MKKAVVSVINDLVTDQRVHRTCVTLQGLGYDVLLVGRHKRDSLTMPQRPYRTHRMNLHFEKGIWFYFFFNLRLYFFLRKQKADLFVANDLDTLWPNYRAARRKKKPLVYDAHEIFTEVPELVNRKFKQRIWKRLERKLVPALKHMITVNDSIAGWYQDRYGIRPEVVRNIPFYRPEAVHTLTRRQAHLPENKKIILLQGAGINIHRGAEEAVEAMKYVDNAVLLIIGGGDVIPVLKEMTEKMHLTDKVIFTGKLPPDELRSWTRLADIGITLDKDTNINYRFSLPNKIFDYIHAGIPVLASDLVEVRRVVEKYNVGKISPDHEPQHIAALLREMLQSEEYPRWKENAAAAACELTGQREQEKQAAVFRQFLA
ncbi:MAG TPA: glycosyltransferase [Bacteroidia bacterium]|nr:glycosyltransferase [Bacteroidia bacterium]